MTTLMDFDFPHDYHCHPAASGTSEYPKKGGRGVTIWGPRTTDIHLPATGVPCDPLKFTCTQPQCYIGDDNCNVTFTIHTAAWSQQKSIVGDITMELVNNVTGARVPAAFTLESVTIASGIWNPRASVSRSVAKPPVSPRARAIHAPSRAMYTSSPAILYSPYLMSCLCMLGEHPPFHCRTRS
jgi:hypothetical protein